VSLHCVCSSSAYETAVMNSTMMPTTKRRHKNVRHPQWIKDWYNYSNFITITVGPPLALVTNGLSLIIFARMYRAKQQVNTIYLDIWSSFNQFQLLFYVQERVILSLKNIKGYTMSKFITMAHVPYIFSLGVIYHQLAST